MNTKTSLHKLLQDFFYQRLINQRDASQRTIATYRDTVRLFLSFAQSYCKKKINRLELKELNSNLVLKFLDYLEKDRKNSVRTRNNRLAAIRSFLQYVLLKEPSEQSNIESILAIPMKKFDRPTIDFLTRKEIEAILCAPNIQSRSGQRDRVLLAVLYNTGARVSEVINIRVGDIHFKNSNSVSLMGKGRKERTIPLWRNTIILIKQWIKIIGDDPKNILFPNKHGEFLTRSGVEYRLKEYVNIASEECPSLKHKKITPHVIRHSTAMHLLQSGVDLTVIALWLGHESITTTHHYIEENIEMKKKALNKLTESKNNLKRFKPNDKFLSFLDTL